MDPIGDVVRLSGSEAKMRQIIKRRFADRYHDLNNRLRGPMNDNIEWPEGGLRTVQSQLKELFAQYSLLKLS